MIFVFRCITGLGNRLCNLMNMFYLHSLYPTATIYIEWLLNHHCGATLADLIDLADYPWIQSGPRPNALYAITSKQHRTRWDSPAEWAKHPIIVSVSHHLYAFVPLEYCRTKWADLRFTPAVMVAVDHKVVTHGVGRDLLQFRQGDLLVLSGGEALIETYRGLRAQYPNALVSEYTQLVPDRPSHHVVDAMADILFSRHCVLRCYSPYSWFSSWIYLLSDCFSNGPLFDPECVTIQCLG